MPTLVVRRADAPARPGPESSPASHHCWARNWGIAHAESKFSRAEGPPDRRRITARRTRVARSERPSQSPAMAGDPQMPSASRTSRRIGHQRRPSRRRGTTAEAPWTRGHSETAPPSGAAHRAGLDSSGPARHGRSTTPRSRVARPPPATAASSYCVAPCLRRSVTGPLRLHRRRSRLRHMRRCSHAGSSSGAPPSQAHRR